MFAVSFPPLLHLWSSRFPTHQRGLGITENKSKANMRFLEGKEKQDIALGPTGHSYPGIRSASAGEK